MPRFKLTQDAFLAPDLLKAGTVIDYDGPLGPHFEPMDAEGEAALEAYYRSNPHAAIMPFDDLPVKSTQPVVVSPPEPDAPLDIGSLAQPGRARPGPTEGGKVLDIK